MAHTIIATAGALETDMMFLTKAELEALTGKQRRDTQARVLRFMGIEHKIRPDGSLAVLRAHVEQELGMTQHNRTNEKTTEPNWGALFCS